MFIPKKKYKCDRCGETTTEHIQSVIFVNKYKTKLKHNLCFECGKEMLYSYHKNNSAE